MIKRQGRYIKLTSIFLTLLSLSVVKAEYRAYQYLVKTKNQNTTSETKTNSKIINSTLNPTSYLAYNGGVNLIDIDLINSWTCPGNTSKKEICSPILRGNNGN